MPYKKWYQFSLSSIRIKRNVPWQWRVDPKDRLKHYVETSEWISYEKSIKYCDLIFRTFFYSGSRGFRVKDDKGKKNHQRWSINVHFFQFFFFELFSISRDTQITQWINSLNMKTTRGNKSKNSWLGRTKNKKFSAIENGYWIQARIQIDIWNHVFRYYLLRLLTHVKFNNTITHTKLQFFSELLSANNSKCMA